MGNSFSVRYETGQSSARKAHDGQPRRSSAKRNDHIEQGAGAVDAPQRERDDTEHKGDDSRRPQQPIGRVGGRRFGGGTCLLGTHVPDEPSNAAARECTSESRRRTHQPRRRSTTSDRSCKNLSIFVFTLQLVRRCRVEARKVARDAPSCAIAASNHALAGDGAKFKSSSFLVVAPAAEAAD